MRSGGHRSTGGRGTFVLAGVLLAVAAAHRAGAAPEEPQPFGVSALGGGDAQTIADALARAPAGTPIVVRTGTYREMLTISRAVEIRGEGADAKDVVVEGTTGPAVRSFGDGVVIRGLTLRLKATGTAPPEAAVIVGGGATTLDGCLVVGNAGSGVLVRQATTQATLVGCRIGPVPGQGIEVEEGSASLERTTIEGAGGNGIDLRTGARVKGKDVVVVEAVQNGVAVFSGSTLELEGGQVRGCHEYGVQGLDAKSKIVLRGVAIPSGLRTAVAVFGGLLFEATDCEWSGLAATGLIVNGEGTRGVLRKCRIHHNHSSGVLFDKGADGLVEDCDIGSSEKVGIELRGGGEVTVRRTKLHEQKTGADLLVHDASTLRVDGCELWGGAVPEIYAYDGATLDVRATTIHDGQDDGVYVEKSSAVLADVTVTKCKSAGFSVGEAGHLEAERCVARESQYGARLSKSSDVVLTACEMTGNLESNLLAEEHAHVTVTGGKFKDGRKEGVYVQGGAEVTLVSVEVTGNKETGVVVNASTLTARTSKIRKNTGVGAWLVGTSVATFEKCDVTDNGGGAWRVDDGVKLVRIKTKPPN